MVPTTKFGVSDIRMKMEMVIKAITKMESSLLSGQPVLSIWRVVSLRNIKKHQRTQNIRLKSKLKPFSMFKIYKKTMIRCTITSYLFEQTTILLSPLINQLDLLIIRPLCLSRSQLWALCMPANGIPSRLGGLPIRFQVLHQHPG